MRTTASILFALLLCGTVAAQELDLSKVTKDDIIATMEHRNKLADQRNAQLAEENNGLKNQLANLQKVFAANQGNADVIPDLNKQIKAQDSEISALKWSRWKYAIISVLIALPVGFLGCIAAYEFTKFGVAVSAFAVKTGIKATIA